MRLHVFLIFAETHSPNVKALEVNGLQRLFKLQKCLFTHIQNSLEVLNIACVCVGLDHAALPSLTRSQYCTNARGIKLLHRLLFKFSYYESTFLLLKLSYVVVVFFLFVYNLFIYSICDVYHGATLNKIK